MNSISHKLSFEHRILLQQMDLELHDSHVNYLYARQLKNQFANHLYEVQIEGNTFELPERMTMADYLKNCSPRLPLQQWYDRILQDLFSFFLTVLPFFFIVCLLSIRSRHEMEIKDGSLILTSSLFSSWISLIVSTYFYFIRFPSKNPKRHFTSQIPAMKLIQFFLTVSALYLILDTAFPKGSILVLPLLPWVPLLILLTLIILLLRYFSAHQQLNQ